MIRTSSRPALHHSESAQDRSPCNCDCGGDRQVIGDGREDIILANLAPAVEPVDVGYQSSAISRQSGRARDRAEPVVAGEELRRGVVDALLVRRSTSPSDGIKPSRAVPHTDRRLVDDGRADQAHPVERQAFFLVQVMRTDSTGCYRRQATEVSNPSLSALHQIALTKKLSFSVGLKSTRTTWLCFGTSTLFWIK